MQALAQFFVLFSGPIGLVLLFAFVVVLWVVRSRRGRKRAAPHLAIVDGADAKQPGEPSAPSTRPPLRVVDRRAAGHEAP